MIDNHIHVKSHKSADAPLLIEETIKSAIQKKLSTITFTEHFTFPKGFIDPSPYKTDSLSTTEYDYLVNQLQKFQIKYADQIEILIGAEVDWLPDYKDEIVKGLKKYNFDYVNGSVHFVGTYIEKGRNVNLGIDATIDLFKKGVDIYGSTKNFIAEYYKYVQDLVKTGIYDNCAHLDLIKKFNIDSELFNQKQKWYIDLVEKTLKIIKKYDMSIEINTSGLLKPCNEIYPSFWILEKANKLGIPLTLGSDTHSPEKVGFEIDKAINYAKSAGYKKVCKYINRERLFIEI